MPGKPWEIPGAQHDNATRSAESWGGVKGREAESPSPLPHPKGEGEHLGGVTNRHHLADVVCAGSPVRASGVSFAATAGGAYLATAGWPSAIKRFKSCEAWSNQSFPGSE